MSQVSQSVRATLTALLSARRALLKGLLGTALLAFLIFVSARPAAAQAAAEYGSAVAGAAANVAGLTKKIDSALSKSKKPDAALSTGKKPASSLSPDTNPGTAPPSAEDLIAANRRALEQRAGKDAVKLTLKSVPTKASVRIDGKTVGLTPLLLTVAPGTYKVEMEGPRMEFGKQQLDLRAQETREVELRLSSAPRYPTQIRLQWAPQPEH